MPVQTLAILRRPAAWVRIQPEAASAIPGRRSPSPPGTISVSSRTRAAGAATVASMRRPALVVKRFPVRPMTTHSYGGELGAAPAVPLSRSASEPNASAGPTRSRACRPSNARNPIRRGGVMGRILDHRRLAAMTLIRCFRPSKGIGPRRPAGPVPVGITPPLRPGRARGHQRDSDDGRPPACRFDADVSRREHRPEPRPERSACVVRGSAQERGGTRFAELAGTPQRSGRMRHAPSWLIGIALLGTGCDLASPSSTPSVYALYRIGDAVLPGPTNPPPPPPAPPAPRPALLGDTLTIPATRGRTGQVVVSRVQVYKAETGGLSRSSTRHNAQAEGDLLIVDTCPLGAYCVAVEPLVSAPFALRFIGDSLVEELPAGSRQKPRVYGRVSRR